MMHLATYNHVLGLARQLNLAEQMKLLQALLGEISSDVAVEEVQKHSILELRGLGSAIWQDVDVEKYIQQERDVWDG